MSIAYYICADVSEDDEDYEVFLDVSGKAIADVDEALLERLAEQANVMPLMSFFSIPEGEWDEYLDEVEDLLEDGEIFDPSEVTWFSPVEGLKTVSGLMSIIEKNPDVLEDAEAVLEDLQAMARVLIHLCERDISWHLAIDI